MPVNQYVQIDTYDYGASLAPVTFHDLVTDALIANGTAASCAELSVDSGTYRAVFTGALPANLIPAGTYRIRFAVSGAPIKRFVTLAGVDGEVAYARIDRHAELDPAGRKLFVTENTGEVAAAAGSVAKLSQGAGGVADWTAAEREQIRYRLGLNGTTTAPTEPTPDPIVITPGTANLTTAWLVARVAGVATPDITIRYQQRQEPDAGTGSSYDDTIYSVDSDVDGLVEMPMVKGGYYYVWRGTGKRPEAAPLLLIPAAAGATYELPSHVGR